MEDIFEELAEEDLREEAVDDPERNEEGGVDGEDDGTKTIVQPKVKRTVKPRPKLDAARLTGPRGIAAIPQTFENIKLKGKNHELDDLTLVLTRLQHWAHRLYPKLNFEDCISRIEELGSKKPVARAMDSLRSGDVVVTDQTDTIERSPSPQIDPFDLLLPSEPPKTTLTEEQKARMLKNRLLAEERRMAKIKAAQNAQNNLNDNSNHVEPENLFTNDDNFDLDAFNQAESQISANQAQRHNTTNENQSNSDHLAEISKDPDHLSHKNDVSATPEAAQMTDETQFHKNPHEVSTLLVENDLINNETTMDVNQSDFKMRLEKDSVSSPVCEMSIEDQQQDKTNDVEKIKGLELESRSHKTPDEISTLLVDNLNNETTMEIDQSIIDAFDEDM